jgi:outer membrane protein OmpA-like peptidoglycan-associated protein
MNISYSQSLILNGGFEDHGEIKCLTCSHLYGQYPSVVYHWDNGGWGCFLCDKNYKQTSVEKIQNICPAANILPKEGQSMIAMHYLPGMNGRYGAASRLSTLTVRPMLVGNLYEVSFWLYIKSNLKSDPNWAKHIGIALLPENVTFGRFTDSRKIPFIALDSVIYDTWFQVKWSVRPLCNSKYLMIGLFAEIGWPQSQSYADSYYFIDNVELFELSSEPILAKSPTYYCSRYEPKALGLTPKMDNTTLFFQIDSSELTDKHLSILDTFVTFAKKYPDLVFELSGHTDSIGADNLNLSQNRVQSVYKYLVENRKIPAFRFISLSMGSKMPYRNNNNEADRILNRRVEIRQINIDLSMIFYKNALISVKKKQYDEAYSMLNKWLIKSSQSQKILLLFDPRFEDLRKNKNWILIEKKIRDGYNTFKYPSYSFLLDSLRLDDRKLIGELPGLLSDLSVIPPEKDTIGLNLPALSETIVQKKLKEHYKQILPIFERIGWPKISEFGESASTSAFMLLLHFRDSIEYSKWLPVLFKYCEDGEANWMHFAILYDRCNILSGKPQRYGTHSEVLENGEFHMAPWEGDENTINDQRAKIGLPLLSMALINSMRSNK